MAHQIPVLGLCNLVNKDSALSEIQVYRLGDFLASHSDIVFPHRHDFYQVLYFTKASGSHTIDFEKHQAISGQIYFMKPGQVHSWHFKESSNGYLVNFSHSFFSSVLINPDYIHDFAFFNSTPSQQVINTPIKLRPAIIALLKQIEEEVAGKSAYRLDYIRIKLLELFILISRNTVSKKAPQTNTHHYLQLKNFQQLVEEYFTTLKLPNEYASKLFITPNHLNTLCKSMLGKPAGDIIRDRVLLEAKRLLVNSHLNITQIAYQLGYNDPSYFVRIFRKQTGSTPEEFRKTTIHHH